jgi:hypothetical protein
MPATGMLLFYLDANLLIPTPSQMKKTLLPIQAVAGKLEILGKYVEQIGPYGAKLRLELLADPAYTRRGKLILVTATSPTVSGEGKTVTAIGLTQGLALLGKRVPRASLRSARSAAGQAARPAAGSPGSSRAPRSISIFMAIFTPSLPRTICSRRSSTLISSTATI